MAESKLTHDQRTHALRLYGEGYKYADIQRELRIQFGVFLHHESIRSTCQAKVNQPIVNRCREDYLRRIKDVPVANKRFRLDDLERERQKINRLLNENTGKTEEEEKRYLILLRALLEIIASARDEMEKRPQLLAGIGLSDEFRDRTDEELVAERDELLRHAQRLIQDSENSRVGSILQ